MTIWLTQKGDSRRKKMCTGTSGVADSIEKDQVTLGEREREASKRPLGVGSEMMKGGNMDDLI